MTCEPNGPTISAPTQESPQAPDCGQVQLQYRHVSVQKGTPGLELTESVISSTPLSDEAAIFLWNSLDMSESCNALVASGLSRIETFTIRGMKERNCTGSCAAIRNVGSGLGWLSGMKRSVPWLLI